MEKDFNYKFTGIAAGTDALVEGKSIIVTNRRDSEEKMAFIIPSGAPVSVIGDYEKGDGSHVVRFDVPGTLIGCDLKLCIPADERTANEWIPVSDTSRLPKDGHSVMIYSEKGGVSEGYLDSSGFWIQYRWSTRVYPTHWCEKIAPPIMKKEN